MGWFDKAKSALGISTEAKDPAPPSRGDPRKRKDGRPPLPEITGAANATLDDVLEARAAGEHEKARAILAAIDKGQGLRTVLRAAAALEASDDGELAPLLSAVASEQPPWQLPLQIAAALEPGSDRDRMSARAVELHAPRWALAWIRTLGGEEAERRAGLVELLFEDAALARTVAAKDLALPEVKPDNDAIRRYTAFAHGRDTIRRFGAPAVAAMFEKALGARKAGME
jgi:hypothetical protein